MKNKKTETLLLLTEKSRLTVRVFDYFHNCSDADFPKFLDSVPPRKLYWLIYVTKPSIFNNDADLSLILSRDVRRTNAAIRKLQEFESKEGAR